MRIVQVKCPNCGQPIYQKTRDEMFLCQNCGTIHQRDAQGPHKVPFEVASPNPAAAGQRSYMPFWRLRCDFIIRSRKVEGGLLHKLATSFNGADNGGSLYIFVPAADLDTATFRRLAVMLTSSPPRYQARSDFAGIERIPTTMGQDEALEMADFVAVTLEAEKPGTLQYLDYELKVQEARLIYLPVIGTPDGPWLAL
ncbi:MAG: hypothetical protein SA339_10450 [Methanomassiliicoccus sp.]|nr:hypothetical protein [Methanomassiliicoccus sp.]